METIEIQQNVPSARLITIYEDEEKTIPMNLTGKTVFISIKEKNDFTLTDDTAIITSKITVHEAPLLQTLWELTATQTKQVLKKYKVDIRVYTDALDYDNSDTFYINIVPVVTQRLT